jgi:hypothetical protein
MNLNLKLLNFDALKVSGKELLGGMGVPIGVWVGPGGWV